jgi:hypothetical protein
MCNLVSDGELGGNMFFGESGIVANEKGRNMSFSEQWNYIGR